MDLVHVLAVWLHTLALVIVLGYYGILGRVVLPALERSLERPTQVSTLMAIERRALPFIVLSMALFAMTGVYLLVIDPAYAGLGNVLASTWTTLMLIKHVLVIVVVGLAIYVDRCIRHADVAPGDDARHAALRRVALSAEAATGIGALTILLTAAAQVIA
ncbi:MAG TPA: hypothetical protein VIZ22_10500 [Candidatus Limnocylindrales bacterium]